MKTILNKRKTIISFLAIQLLFIVSSCTIKTELKVKGEPLISIQNLRTNEQVVNSLAETTTTCPNINAQIGDTLSVYINIEELDIKKDEVLISYMQVIFLSDEIDIKEIPASFNFIIPEVPSGTYPITFNGSYSVTKEKKTFWGEGNAWGSLTYPEVTIARVVI